MGARSICHLRCFIYLPPGYLLILLLTDGAKTRPEATSYLAVVVYIFAV
jgi:hypothetical protein